MKKIKLFVIILLVMSLLLGCGDSAKDNENLKEETSKDTTPTEVDTTESSPAKDSKEQELEMAKTTYKLLNESSDVCSALASTISITWEWAIENLNDPEKSVYGVKLLANKLHLDVEKLKAVNLELNFAGDTKYLGYADTLIDFSDAVNCVIMYYYNEGLYSKLKTDLETCKTNIKALTTESPYYQNLKNYYSELVNFEACCESPSGSFKDLGNTIKGYEDSLAKYKSDLSFDLE